MSWTTAEEARIRAIETCLNNVQTAITNLMSKQQFTQLLLIKQKEIDALTKRVEALETQITILQKKLG